MGDSGLASFIREGLRHPAQIAALAPSSQYLAREMLEGIAFDGGPVLELGPGTGVFTREAIRQGCAQEKLHLIEMNRNFCTELELKYPAASIYNISAGEISSTGVERFQTVLSGLPVLSMPRCLQTAILEGIFSHLAPDGLYVQFTYGAKPPYPLALLERFNLTWSRSRRVWRNVPPATVYRFRRREALRKCENMHSLK